MHTTPIKKTFRAAIIGTGFIGPVHLEGLRRAGVEVIGLLGSSSEKSRQAAERWNVPKAYADLDALLADPDVDVVHITSPNRDHFEQARRVLLAGKHVLCEKPLSMNSEQSSQLVALARQTGLAAGVNYNIRYYPLCIEASQRVRSGSLGRIHHVAGSYVQDWLLHPTDFNWRLLADEGGELRAIADIGTHWLDLIQFIVGEPITEVCSDLMTALPERQRPVGNVETFSAKLSDGPRATIPISVTTDDFGSVLFRFANGSRGIFWVSQVTAGRKNCLRFELAGSAQALAWESERPNELWIGHRDRPNESLTRDPALLSDRARRHADYPGGHNEGFPDTFKQLFRDFYGYLAGGCKGDPTFPTFADGHREIVMCEAILQSHRERRWVEVSG